MRAILGLSAHYHDAAAALVVDGVPVCAVQEERLSRRKSDAAFPLAAIEWCLDEAGLAPDDLEAVVFYEKPMLKFDRILTMALRTFPRSWQGFSRGMKNALGGKLWVKGTISSQLGIPGRKVLFTEHHRAHAAAAFLCAPTREAAILTADGVGEWATLSLGRGRQGPQGTSIELLRELRFPHSLGMLYSTFTAWLGFPVNEGEYKVMGLAAYGRPTFRQAVERIVQRTPDGGFRLDLAYFDYPSGKDRSYSDELVRVFGPPRDPHAPLDPATPAGAHYANVAASVQRVLEDVLVDLARRLQRETGLSDLCLGGGVALNGCANARILRESGFARVFVPSAPGDAGCALGAALLAERIHFRGPFAEAPDHPFLGPRVSAAELSRVAAEDGLPIEEVPGEGAFLERLAQLLAEGRIVGFMDGAAEFGPRALGHRSILAAPHEAAMRDRLNRGIKFREEFRPFAPAVPLEEADRFFELPTGGARLGRYMSGVFPVRPEWLPRLRAIAHVDGTSRVQTVERAMAPRFHALLVEYGKQTGIPVLLNTSFNLAGEPIVNRAVEGYSTFRRSGIDVLAVGNALVWKKRALASSEGPGVSGAAAAPGAAPEAVS
jgi:carbamoyltransferase